MIGQYLEEGNWRGAEGTKMRELEAYRVPKGGNRRVQDGAKGNKGWMMGEEM